MILYLGANKSLFLDHIDSTLMLDRFSSYTYLLIGVGRKSRTPFSPRHKMVPRLMKAFDLVLPDIIMVVHCLEIR